MYTTLPFYVTFLKIYQCYCIKFNNLLYSDKPHVKIFLFACDDDDDDGNDDHDKFYSRILCPHNLRSDFVE